MIPTLLALTFGLLPAHAMKLTSADIAPGGKIADTHVFSGFGCSGKNQSPALTWTDAPKEAQSFAVMVHDADAPTGGAGWWHWVVYDLPATTTSLPANVGDALPSGAKQGTTDFGAPGWGGPCPPAGDKPHRYTFTVYALKVPKLELPANATASLVGFMVNANTIAKAEFQGVYSR